MKITYRPFIFLFAFLLAPAVAQDMPPSAKEDQLKFSSPYLGSDEFSRLTAERNFKRNANIQRMIDAMRPSSSSASRSRFGLDDTSTAKIQSLSEEINRTEDDNDHLASLHAKRAACFESIFAFDLAAIDCESANRLVSSSENLKTLADALRKSGRFQKAIQRYDQMLESKKDPMVLIARAACHVGLNEFENASADLTEATSMAKGNAKIELAIHRFSEELREKQKIANRNTTIPLLEEQRNARIREIETSLKTPNNPQKQALQTELADLLSDLFSDQSTQKEASETLLKTASRLMELQPENANAQINYARSLFANGQVEEARKILDELVNSPPGDPLPTSLVARSNLLAAVDEIDQAIADLSRAIKIAPDNKHAIRERCQLLIFTEQYTRAAEEMQRLIELEDSYGYFGCGNCHQILGNGALAVSNYSRGMQLPGANESDFIFRRAKSLMQLKARDLAFYEYRRANELGLYERGARFELGNLRLERKEYEKAILDFTFEIENGLAAPIIILSRGKAYQELGKFTKAKEDFQVALNTSNDSSTDAVMAKNSLDRLKVIVPLKAIFSKIRRNDPKELRQEFAEPIRGVLDDEKLKQRVDLINKFTDSYRWTELGIDPNLGNQKVTILFDNPLNEKLTVWRDSADQLLGIEFESRHFSIDTMDAVIAPSGLIEHANQFWNAIHKRDLDRVYELMLHGRNSKLLDRDEVIRTLGPILETFKELEVKAIELHSVRIRKPTETDQFPALEVFQQIRMDDDTYDPCRIIYEVDESNTQFKMGDYRSGTFAAGYCHFDSKPQAKFLEAITSGDPQKVIELVHPFERGSIDPSILQAYQEALAKKTGTFEKFGDGEFRIRTNYEDGVRKTRSEGFGQFSQGRFQVTLSHTFGHIDSFDWQFEDLDWKQEIQDTNQMEKYGADFLFGLIMNSSRETHRNLPDGFEHMNEERIESIKQSCLEVTGDLKEVKIQKVSFDEEEGNYNLEYQVIGEKKTVPGLVVLELDAFRASLFSFNIFIHDGDEE